VSTSIWTQCGGRRNAGAYHGSVWRVVEAQHRNSTRRLVDSDAEQALLEALLDRVKPPAPTGPEFQGLHYLLATPFRHPPLPHGSRFGTRAERSLFYASEAVETALAEAAYYRLLFLEGSAADLDPVTVELTTFEAALRTRRAVDLSARPFRAHLPALTSKTRYDTSQALGSEMRADAIDLVRYPSARDAAGGTNVALFSPGAFARKTPRSAGTWRCVATRAGVEMAELDWSSPQRRLVFPREQFLVRGALPAPAP
jgi:hypothetical protein